MSLSDTRQRSHAAVDTLRVCKFRAYGAELIGLVMPNGEVRPLPPARSLEDALRGIATGRLDVTRTVEPVLHVEVIAPIDRQDVWDVHRWPAPGGRTSAVERPPFLAATHSRVVGPAGALVVPNDSHRAAPRFTVALWLDAELHLLGIGLATELHPHELEPRATWARGCALGPAVLPVTDRWFRAQDVVLECSVDRDGGELWGTSAPVSLSRTSLDAAVDSLRRDSVFPEGVVLLTDCAVSPPKQLGLREGDVVTVTAHPLGTLSNRVRVGLRQADARRLSGRA